MSPVFKSVLVRMTGGWGFVPQEKDFGEIKLPDHVFNRIIL